MFLLLSFIIMFLKVIYCLECVLKYFCLYVIQVDDILLNLKAYYYSEQNCRV